jgi:hypothetical protein
LTRILDDRGRIFGKVNIVDIIVLVVIVAIVVFAAVRFSGGEAVASVPVKITFVQTKVDNARLAGLPAEGTIKDNAGNVIGDLVSVEATPALEDLLTSGGQYKAFPSSIKSDVTFVVSGEGTVSDSTVHIGKLAARVGADVRIVGPGYEAQTTIVDVVWGQEASK